MLTVISGQDKNLKSSESEGVMISGECFYYHYLCDGFDDRGWGCGYRTLQSICSWIINHRNDKLLSVPSVNKIQKILTTIEDKPKSFLCSREWIGSFEACLVIDHLFDVPCRILHLNSGIELSSAIETLIEHFKTCGCPVMMGGNVDSSSKGVFGVKKNKEHIYLLIVDPHYVGKELPVEALINQGWINWTNIDEFLEGSFYNLCLPQIKSS